MLIKIIIGTQWGDEGKGKFIDYFGREADFVVRYNGSAGAAHTVVNKYGKFKLHLLPSGVFNKNSKILITQGVVVEPQLLLEEINIVAKAGINLNGRLFISPRCHLVFPYHKILDGLTNARFAGFSKKSPTTGRGNGPANADKISYQGIRFYDILNKEAFKIRLKAAIDIKAGFISSLNSDLGAGPLNFREILHDYLNYGRKLKPYIKETLPILEMAIKDNKNIFFEGVNGLMLDNDWGAYPYVTTASILPTDVAKGSGINPYLYPHKVVGAAKAYMTRVDNGECPLPSEWPENRETKEFRDKANEYASGTGRPRRIAWFDTEVVKFTHRMCHLDYLCLTRLDTLSGLKKIKICTGYLFMGKKVNYFDGDAEFYRKVKPIYEEMAGWNQDLSSCRKYGKLPVNVRKYIEKIEKTVGVPVKYVSVGAEREKTIKRN